MKAWPIWLSGMIAVLATLLFSAAIIGANWSELDLSLRNLEQVGNSFGVLNVLFTGGAFLLILYTLVIQQHELRLQKQEMARMVATQQRIIHMELLKYAIDDETLSKVWGERVEFQEARQMAYINLILSQWEMNFQQGLMTDEEIKVYLDKHMAESNFFRFFWEKVGVERKEYSDAGSEKSKIFHQAAERAYQAAINSEKRAGSAE